VGRSPPSGFGPSPRCPDSTLLRREPTPLVAGKTARALRRQLLVVPVADALALLTAVRPPGGHASLVKEGCADVPSAQELEGLLYLAGRNPGVVAGTMAARVAKGQYGVAQAGHQVPRGITAEFPGVKSNHSRQPLGNTIRGTWSSGSMAA